MLFSSCIFYLPLCANESQGYKLFSGNANPQLAESIAHCLGMELSRVSISRFNDGEIKIKVEENVRNSDVFLIQPMCATENGSVNDNLMELFLLIRTMRRSDVGNITAVIPYYGYARQDPKNRKPRANFRFRYCHAF